MSMVSYGASVANDSELRLCGDVNGKRVLELGVGTPSNAIDFALQGARSMAIDPSTDRITQLRRQAEQAEVTVQCHVGDVADLGFATSASVDLAIAVNTLGAVDDLARLLRQVHRILKPAAAFVIAETHPVAAMLAPPGGGASGSVVHHAYGAAPSRSFSDLLMTFQRTNFQIDMMHELMSSARGANVAPAVLVLRIRKLGD